MIKERKLYNELGQEVANEMPGAAYEAIESNSVNTADNAVPRGLYFYRIEANDISGLRMVFMQVKKMITMH